MNTMKRYNVNLNDIIVKIVRDAQPIGHHEIWFEIGESLNGRPIPSQQEVDVCLEQIQKRNILKKITIPDGREKYLLLVRYPFTPGGGREC